MNGSLAQLVERHVYTVDVIGSIPVGPTTEEPRHSGAKRLRTGGVLCVDAWFDAHLRSHPRMRAAMKFLLWFEP